jgi:UDP-glucuronate decarboxylase
MTNTIHKEDILNIVKSLKKESRKISKKKILLIGYNGFLGKYFTEVFFHLSKKLNFELDCCDNFISSKKDNKKRFNNFKYINGDILKINLKKKYDLIICLAGIASPALYKKFPLETLDVSYLGVKRLLKKAQKDNSEFIFFSSSEIYGNPDIKNIPTNEKFYGFVNSFGPRSCYDEGKRIGETLCYIYKTYFNVKIKIIRPFNVFGPLMAKNDFRIIPNIVQKILNNRQILVHGKGTQTRTFCYISDAITGFFKVILNGKIGEIYNIGNPYNEMNIIKLVKIFDQITGKKNKFKKISYPKNYPGDEPLRRCPNIDKVIKDTGFKPLISVKKGIRRILEFNNIT